MFISVGRGRRAFEEEIFFHSDKKFFLWLGKKFWKVRKRVGEEKGGVRNAYNGGGGLR